MPFLFLSSVFGFLAVALGAFAAHALKSHWDEYSLSIFRTAVEYQFWHALALGIVAILHRLSPHPLISGSGSFFAVGIVLFSGSLYALAATKIRMLGAITPLGGVCFLVGWILLIAYSVKKPF